MPMPSWLPKPPPQPARWRQAFQFRVERLLLKGAHYRLGFIAVLLALVALSGGVAVELFARGEPDGAEAVWWAFLRLTDPGYLGDDEGAAKRLISTLVTVCGYVLFMGALIAIMTQWLEATVRQLERGETPIAMEGHILILGSVGRVAALIEELLFSQHRLERFLSLRRTSALRIVVMSDEVDAHFRSELRTRLGPLWNEHQLILRSGSRLRQDHLERVDVLNAAAILIPAGEEAEESERDAATIKALLSVVHHPRLGEVDQPPRIVAEVKDHRVLELVRRSYPGRLDLVPGDLVIGRFIAHTLRHHGLSHVLGELLVTQTGNNLLFRAFPGLEGVTFLEAAQRFEDAVLLGVVREEAEGRLRPWLNPMHDFRLAAGDICVCVAPGFEISEPAGSVRDPLAPCPERHTVGEALAGERRVLVVGWSARVPDLLVELETYREERFVVDNLSKRTVEERELELRESGYSPERVALRLEHGDTTQAEVYRQLPLQEYDTIVFMGRGRVHSGEASDARTLLGYLALRAVWPQGQPPPPIVIELLDEDNLGLFERRAGELLVSSGLLSHVLAQVALRPELGAVVEELFTVGGTELHFRPAEELELLGRPLSFREIQRAVWQEGEVALGLRVARERREPGGGVYLNPKRGRAWTLEAGDQVVVLSTY